DGAGPVHHPRGETVAHQFVAHQDVLARARDQRGGIAGAADGSGDRGVAHGRASLLSLPSSFGFLGPYCMKWVNTPATAPKMAMRPSGLRIDLATRTPSGMCGSL